MPDQRANHLAAARVPGELEEIQGTAVTRLTAALPVVGLYCFELEAQDSVLLPGFAGSALRGLLGRGLKRTVCVTRLPACNDCSLHRTCVYPFLFETPAGLVGEQRRRYATAVHPFVLRLPWDKGLEIAAREHFTADIALFGVANDLLPYVINALDLAGRSGIGRSRSRFRVTQVRTLPRSGYAAQTLYERGGPVGRADWPQLDMKRSAPARCHVLLETPIRLKRKGRLVGPLDFDELQLVTALVRRAELLAGYYGHAVAPVSKSELDRLASGLAFHETSLAWVDWTRYSSRQETHMQLGGVVGGFHLQGPGLGELWPLLELGQELHLGKATSMGLGRYRVEAATSLSEQTAEAIQ